MSRTDVPPPDIAQLLTEEGFIRHCTNDFHHSRKIDGISKEFLRATEADKFLEPLLQIEGETVQEDGSKKKALVNYYSPHQIYIVAALSKNSVHEGLLWGDFKNIDFYKQQGFRMVNWGWSGFAFNITQLAKSDRHPDLNFIQLSHNFHQFLLFLHTLQQLRYSPSRDRNKDRLFSAAPSLYFDFSPLKANPKLLNTYSLSVEWLKSLAVDIARLACDTDPMEHWFYYINRHPLWRKDLLKGDAQLAQELYAIYDLIWELLEATTGEKQPPMFEFLYGQKNIYPYLIPRAEFVQGTDVKSIWAAIAKFKEWTKQGDNKNFVDETTLSRLDVFEKELKEFEEKYGARSFISNGIREVELEEKIKMDDLDGKTKQYINQIIRQAEEERTKSKRKFLSLWDDEIEERIRSKELTLEQAKKEDYDLFIKHEIREAIEQRLSSLRRELWDIFDAVQKRLAKKADEAWRIEHDFGNHFWFLHKEMLNALPREEQHKLYQAEYRKAYDEAMQWGKKRDEFGEVEHTMDLLFCSRCRSKPIKLHQDHNEGQFSAKPICESCFSDIRNAALDDKTIGTIKEGEWKCSCGKILFKFAANNVVAIKTFNEVPIKIELEYGRNTLEAKCPQCGEINQRSIDWGWLP